MKLESSSPSLLPPPTPNHTHSLEITTVDSLGGILPQGDVF